MSTQRFPRQKFVRALIRIEDELAAWAAGYAQEAAQTQDRRVEAYATDRQYLLEEVIRVIHDAADLLSHMPLRSHRVWADTSRRLH